MLQKHLGNQVTLARSEWKCRKIFHLTGLMDLSFKIYIYIYISCSFFFMQTRDQEEHPVLKSDHLVHNFGLFKQVRKWSHFSRREIMFSSDYTKVFLVSFLCEKYLFLFPVFDCSSSDSLSLQIPFSLQPHTQPSCGRRLASPWISSTRLQLERLIPHFCTYLLASCNLSTQASETGGSGFQVISGSVSRLSQVNKSAKT